MHEQLGDQTFLKEQFLQDAKVFDAARGYLSVPSFNLRIDSRVLQAAARLVAAHFDDEKIQIVHGIPHSGTYFATAVSLALKNPVHLHSSRKDQFVPATWKEIMRQEVRSFTGSLGGVDVFSGLNFSFVRKGDRVLLVDDVCAKGDTAHVIIEALQKRGVVVVGFAVLFDKVWQGGIERVEQMGVKTFSCIRVKRIDRNDQVQLLK